MEWKIVPPYLLVDLENDFIVGAGETEQELLPLATNYMKEESYVGMSINLAIYTLKAEIE